MTSINFIELHNNELDLINGGVNWGLVWSGAGAIVLGGIGVAGGGVVGKTCGVVGIVGGVITVVAGVVY